MPLLEISKIKFDDSEAGEIPIDDVVIVHYTPIDAIFNDAEEHVIPARKAIETQLFVAKALGFPYKTHQEALEDYVSVHWAWLERKQDREETTTILRKDTP
jgi:hypothetical protein